MHRAMGQNPAVCQTQIKPQVKLFSLGFSALLTAMWGFGGRAIAQSYPVCEPPATGEYLLLIVSQTEQSQLRRILPPNASTTVCRYLDNIVTRVGGFSDPEVANSWAQYLTDMDGVQAFVARPLDAATLDAATPDAATVENIGDQPSSQQPQPVAPITGLTQAQAITPSSESASPSGNAYNPQPLAAGYAVLIDYFNRPEVATEVQQVLGSQVGLVSYGQRPYLLALHTSDPAVANSVLQQLSDRNFLTLMVDSRRVVLLTPAVAAVE